jgi:D-alanyl-lipoteichoic acid acyltransferase DltB (MBOAT superfamily)
MFNWSFDSFSFLFFLIPVFFIYRGLFFLPQGNRLQVLWIALSGILYYAVLQWQYLFLLGGSGLLAFWGARRMNTIQLEKKRWWYAAMGVSLHVLVLLLFKYGVALIDFFMGAMGSLGQPNTMPNWVLPLGISFFTFQLIAYWVDVYQENIEPETDFGAFMGYLFFFPKILAGPITRAQHFLPALKASKPFDAALASEGLTQWAWGLFKKRIVSDTAALYVHRVFMPDSEALGGDYWLACFIFPFQLYADFSGYSDMAIGIGKLFGFRLPPNFNYPFFARNISDYWQRWHMSLTGWMMDYVYTPCAFAWRRKGKWGVAMAITLTFLLVGIWHGPKWVYVVFGLVYSVYFLPRIIFPPKEGKSLWPVWLARLGLYFLVSITSVIIQSETLAQVGRVYNRMLHSFEHTISLQELSNGWFLFPAAAMWMLDYFGLKHNAEFPLHAMVIRSSLLRRLIVLIIVVLLFYVQNEQLSFLYFQF